MKFQKKVFKNLPKPRQWSRFFNVLSRKERVIFLGCFVVFIITASYLNVHYYLEKTEVVPKEGGEYVEGIVGEPRFISPLYLSDNDVDRDLVEILFSGLLKYDSEGNIVKDLAKDYEIKDGGKTFEFSLKDNLFWSDGKKLTAEDVAFTVELVQSPQYKSPQRIEWLGVNVEVVNDKKIIFRLEKSYSSFLETVARLKIIPKHVFENIPSKTLPWILTSKEYLVGAGPFKVKEIVRDQSNSIKKIVLVPNEYATQKPFLKKITFYFYKTKEELLKEARTGRIKGFAISDPSSLKALTKEGFKVYPLSFPRYFALFFNLRDSLIGKNQTLRKAISLAVDKRKILERLFENQGEIVNSPVLASYFNIPESTSSISNYNPQKAIELLEKEGFQINPQTHFREKTYIKKVPKLFKEDLKKGDRGESVRKLQECLARFPDIYPEGEISGYFGEKTKKAVIRFQEKYAQEILAPLGLKKGTGKVGGMTREKLNVMCQELPTETIPLKLVITTVAKFPLIEIAKELKEQLEKIGVEVEIKTVSLAEFQTEVLEKRNFEALVFGQALGMIPDPFPFWHSSQKDYPGLNITGVSSKKIDTVLENIRQTTDENERKKYFLQLQEELLQQTPAVFLVRPYYFYILSREIKNFSTEKITDLSKRFVDISNWYIKTKRVPK